MEYTPVNKSSLLNITLWNGTTDERVTGHETSPPCTIPDYYGPYFRIFKITIDVYVVGFLCVFGIVANGLSVAVLRCMKGSTTPLLLLALAIADTFYLLTCLVFQTLRVLYAYFPTLNLSWEPYVEQWIWPFASIAQMSAVYMVVLVTADRWWAICFPLKSRRTSTRCKAILAVLLVLVWSLIFNAPTFLDMEVRYITTSCRMEARASPWFWNPDYQLYYKTIACFTFRTLLPLAVVIGLNMKLIQTIRMSRRSELGSTDNRESNSINILIATVVTVFIICSMPDFIYRVLNTIEMYNANILPLDWTFFAYFGTVTNLMLTLNSSVNFLIYCVTGAKFRYTLVRLYQCSGMGVERRDYKSMTTMKTLTTRLSRSTSSGKGDMYLTHAVDTSCARKSPSPKYVHKYKDSDF